MVRWHARRGIVRPTLTDGPRFLKRLAVEVDLPIPHRYCLSGQGHRSLDQQILVPWHINDHHVPPAWAVDEGVGDLFHDHPLVVGQVGLHTWPLDHHCLGHKDVDEQGDKRGQKGCPQPFSQSAHRVGSCLSRFPACSVGNRRSYEVCRACRG